MKGDRTRQLWAVRSRDRPNKRYIAERWYVPMLLQSLETRKLTVHYSSIPHISRSSIFALTQSQSLGLPVHAYRSNFRCCPAYIAASFPSPPSGTHVQGGQWILEVYFWESQSPLSTDLTRCKAGKIPQSVPYPPKSPSVSSRTRVYFFLDLP